MKNKILFFENNLVKLKNKQKLREWINNCVADRKYVIICVNFIFCTKKEIQDLNKKYLKKDNLTDVIAFNYENKKNIFADVYMCYDVIKENSRLYSVKIKEEVHRVMIHGILHLCGLKDQKTKEKNNMTQFENFYLQKLKIQNV
tara:strand:+ start:131 stop:562 length:432 start_codon:yes stop_codon:yes gene_type:complete